MAPSPSPANPVPVPSPVLPGFPTTQEFFASGSGGASGAVAASGDVTGAAYFSGPHLIERQRMDLEGVRVPRFSINNTWLGLSGECSATYQIYNTMCIFKVTSNYSRVKSYESFPTTTYQQNQTFAVLGTSADQYGASYGTSSTFDASTFGTGGSIVTNQEYINRRAWVEGTDSEVHKTNVAYNAYFVTSGVGQPATFVDAESNMSKFISYGPQPNQPGSLITIGWTPAYSDAVGRVGAGAWWLNNGYDYSQENIFGLRNCVDSLGNAVTALNLYEATPLPDPNYASTPLRDQGIVEYSSMRHDWSVVG
jgi:hypothetical protein